ncbi:6-phosphogluconolactonase [Gracilariopsis chorda]|uniref:6-phosphogluconolactonase n=1 Tax=Gracilariopsis chorda TaxID=448386 RepID=A0A2V3J477_9FLOR|nr:6-phosphogluconolactonase [Gracilariopsis chorda]|eukprot:PXF49218.1 6-phosphogluconolactonase [Gracilariopsis chorda]
MAPYVSIIALLTVITLATQCDACCPSSFSLALGSYTNHAWYPPSKGTGVYIVDYANDQLWLSKVLKPSITNENPAYLAVRRPFIYVANENYPINGSVTRVFLSDDRNTVSSTFANASGHFTTYVAMHSEDIVMGANFLSSFDTYISRGDTFMRARSFVVPPELASEIVTNMTLGPMFGQPHPHIVLPYREGVIVCDAGSNIIWYFRLDFSSGALSMINRVQLRVTDGPRHAVKHTMTDTLYILNEVSVSLAVLKPSHDGVQLQYMMDVLEEKQEGVTLAAIRTTQDGRFLYVSVRNPGTTDGAVVAYRLNRHTGDIQHKIGMWSTFGVHARDFCIIERARFMGRCTSFLASVHRDSDNLVLIERDRGSGMLRPYPAATLNVSTPTSVTPIW